jgi:hypothetical protein
MTGAKNSHSGATVLDRKIRLSVRRTLGWDTPVYTRYLRSMPVAERRLILNRYGEVCAAMAGRYPQWSSNLMLEWDGNGDKSSYLAAYARKATPVPVQTLAQHRLLYLDLLYARLPFHERKVYGQLLSPGYLASGAMPDIPAAYVLYKMQDLIQQEQYQVSENVMWMQAMRLLPACANATDIVVGRVGKALGEGFETALKNTDSLLARLMLNTVVNRFCLELAELSRLCGQAAEEMTALVRHLRLVFGPSLPSAANLEQVRQVVATAMAQPATANWRPFKGRALDHIMARAYSCADTDNLMAQSPEAEPFRWHCVLLTALAVAWSYCSNDSYDTRLVLDNHRTSDVISGRAPENAEEYPPGLMLYHRRQFKLLWHSGQMLVLDPDKLAQEHAGVQYLRDAMQAVVGRFKTYTLKQWAELDVKLSTLLKGSRWDQQEPLVAQPPS